MWREVNAHSTPHSTSPQNLKKTHTFNKYNICLGAAIGAPQDDFSVRIQHLERRLVSPPGEERLELAGRHSHELNGAGDRHFVFWMPLDGI